MAIIKLMVEAGDMKPGPTIAQQLGPMGLNLGKVISDINTATKEFSGMTVPVNLDVDTKTKSYSIRVLSPSVSAMLKKELGISAGSGARKKSVVGNIAFEQIISIAVTKHSSMLAKDFISALKSVIGSCLSLGVLIDSKDPKQILEEIEEGKYSKEINNKITQVSEEKKQELHSFFNKLSFQQEAVKKKEEEEKAAEEAAKTAAATAKPAVGSQSQVKPGTGKAEAKAPAKK